MAHKSCLELPYPAHQVSSLVAAVFMLLCPWARCLRQSCSYWLFLICLPHLKISMLWSRSSVAFVTVRGLHRGPFSLWFSQYDRWSVGLGVNGGVLCPRQAQLSLKIATTWLQDGLLDQWPPYWPPVEHHVLYVLKCLFILCTCVCVCGALRVHIEVGRQLAGAGSPPPPCGF